MEFLYCILYLAILSITIFLIGRFFPRKWIYENCFPFRCFTFEKGGKIYEKIGVKKWKTLYPDGSMIFHKILPNLYPKKRLDGSKLEKIPILIKESCIAEGTHVIAGLLGFFCIAIWKKVGGIIVSIVYFIINIPPIIIQRYNRPRLQKTLFGLVKN